MFWNQSGDFIDLDPDPGLFKGEENILGQIYKYKNKRIYMVTFFLNIRNAYLQ